MLVFWAIRKDKMQKNVCVCVREREREREICLGTMRSAFSYIYVYFIFLTSSFKMVNYPKWLQKIKFYTNKPKFWVLLKYWDLWSLIFQLSLQPEAGSINFLVWFEVGWVFFHFSLAIFLGTGADSLHF